jgi:small subunit ribosomal protein S8
MKHYLYNMLATIKNGQMIKRAFVLQPRKKICENVLKVLWAEGFILGYAIENDNLKIFLKYIDGQPVIDSLVAISKPGRRIYYSIKQLWKLDSNKYFLIISTNKGLKTLVDCKRLKIGGEPVLVVK